MKTRFLAPAFALLAIAACSSKEPAPIPQAASVDSVAPPSVPAADTARIHHEQEIRTAYVDLLRKDSVANAPAVREVALGLNPERNESGRGFCQRFERTDKWSDLKNELTKSPFLAASLDINPGEVQRHYVANVKAIAPMLLRQEGKTSDEFPDNVYRYSECGGGGYMLDVMDKVMSWVLDSGLEPDSVGLTRQAIRAKAASIMASEVRGYIKGGTTGILNCHCESPIPFYFDKYRFTRQELGFSENEWKLALTDSSKKG